MAAVRSRNTDPELALRKALYAAGIRGWRCHYHRAPGTPDLAWPARRLAVFVDGAFWHGHPSRHRQGRSGTYWDEKIRANVERDRRVDAALSAAGWRVIRLWDFEIRRELARAVDAVRAELLRFDASKPLIDAGEGLVLTEVLDTSGGTPDRQLAPPR